MSKTNFELLIKHFKVKCWWNETDYEILPVFAYFLWNLKFIFLIQFPWEIVFGVISDNYIVRWKKKKLNSSATATKNQFYFFLLFQN